MIPVQESKPEVTIVVATKNRKADLRRALNSCVQQRGATEVLVIDDGSTDGTSEMVRREFPTVRLERADVSLDVVAQRNRAAQMATGDFIFSIDDDAAFSSASIVEDTLKDFDDPRVAAVAIPFMNVLRDKIVRQSAPAGGRSYVTATYIGTAYAIKRDAFLRLGGYRVQLLRQFEESDFCIRLLNQGYVVKLGSADLIHHFESPIRDLRRMDLYGGRNQILFEWFNAPTSRLAGRMARTIVGRLKWALTTSNLPRGFRGIWMGFHDIPSEWACRNAVSPRAYSTFRHLLKRGPIPMSEALAMLNGRTAIEQNAISGGVPTPRLTRTRTSRQST